MITNRIHTYYFIQFIFTQQADSSSRNKVNYFTPPVYILTFLYTQILYAPKGYKERP